MGSPRDPHGRVFAQLGDALRRAGSHQEALSLLLDGVAEHPNFSPGHLVLAWTAQESGDLEVARAAYERTVQLDPENPNGMFGLGALLDRAGDPRGGSMMEEAESLDRRVRVLAPRLPLDAGDGSAPGLTPLQDLPFVSLRDLAPDDRDSELAALPFVSLADLAPVGPEEDLGDAELAALPFIPLDALAPEAPPAEAGLDATAEEEELETLPFVAVDDLAPGDEGEMWEDEVAIREDEALEEEDDEPLGGPLVTRTMGELLVRQGLMVQAVEVFEQLVEEEPEDQALRDRLLELRGALADEPVEPAHPGDHAGESRQAEAEAAHPSVDPPRHHPPIPSPFHPEEEDGEDDVGEGPPVGDYFARLLAWTPRRSTEDDGGGSSAS